MTHTMQAVSGRRAGDFWIFWAGQTVSQIGSALTSTALPLLVFKLSGSALDLGLASAATWVPYALFGLFIGAWVDRVNRKRLMIGLDICRAALLAVLPLLASARTSANLVDLSRHVHQLHANDWLSGRNQCRYSKHGSPGCSTEGKWAHTGKHSFRHDHRTIAGSIVTGDNIVTGCFMVRCAHISRLSTLAHSDQNKL